MGADIALFPEMWSNGYDLHSLPAKEWKQDALPCDGEFVRTFGKLAEELEMAIAVTFLEKTEGDPRNTLVLF